MNKDELQVKLEALRIQLHKLEIEGVEEIRKKRVLADISNLRFSIPYLA